MIKLKFEVSAPDFDLLVGDRGLGKIHKAAGELAMDHFIRKMLPKRFDGSMNTELQFRPRSEKYKRSKRGRADLDHYYTGKTKRTALELAVPKITAKGIGTRLKGLGAQYARVSDEWTRVQVGFGKDGKPKYKKTRRVKPITRPKMREELMRMSTREGQLLGQLYVKRFTFLLKKAMDENRVILTNISSAVHAA